MEKLIEVTMEELIAYSKQKEVPAVTVIDDLEKEELEEYVLKIAERLRLLVIKIKKSKKIAIIKNQGIAKKIAKNLNKKSQIMYYDFARRPSGSITIFAMTGYTKNWITLRDNGYIVKAYDEKGEEIEKWINTDTKKTKSKKLDDLKLTNYTVTVAFRGVPECRSREILMHSRKNFIEDGIWNEKRKCYYPKEKNTNKEIAEYNKLEKLFQKIGFQSI